MARWWEYDSGPSIKVPERESDSRTEFGMFCFVASLLSWVVMIVAYLMRAWSVCWWAIAFGVLFSLCGLPMFKDRTRKPVIAPPQDR